MTQPFQADPSYLDMLERVDMTDQPDGILVSPVWRDVDRPITHTWLIPATKRRLAQRLRRCIEAGAGYSHACIGTDTAGQTYVATQGSPGGPRISAQLEQRGW